MARGRDRNFDYTPSYEDTVEQAEKRPSFDNTLKDVKMFKARQGANLIRIMPPTWRFAEGERKHYGLLIRLHRDIGPRDRAYLCLKENDWSPEKRCPICDALYDLGRHASQEDKRALGTQESYLAYIIDRDAEKEGPQVWQYSVSTNAEIAAQSMNRRSKAVLNICHTEHGYDLEFTRTGTGRNNTRYRGFHIMREESPLADSDRDYDRWMDEIADNPLPDVLNFYSYEHIEEVYNGRSKDEEPRSRRGRDRDDDDRGSDRRRDRDEDDEPRTRSRNRGDDYDDEPSPRARSRDRDDSGDRAGDDNRSRRSDSREDDDRVRGRESRPDREEEEERPRERERTRLARDLDDEIPSEGGRRARSNGRDEDETRAVRVPREQEVLPPEETPRRSTRARFDDNGSNGGSEERPRRNAEEEERPRRGREDDGDDDNERARSRARERLNRDERRAD